jgi:hypothetical protein
VNCWRTEVQSPLGRVRAGDKVEHLPFGRPLRDLAQGEETTKDGLESWGAGGAGVQTLSASARRGAALLGGDDLRTLVVQARKASLVQQRASSWLSADTSVGIWSPVAVGKRITVLWHISEA